MPNVEAEVYKNNKSVTGKRKKLKSLIRFHSVNKINDYNREGVGEGGKKKKKRPKRNYRTSQSVRIINVFLEKKNK